MVDGNWPAGTHYVESANLAAAFFENAAAGGDADLLFEKHDGEWSGRSSVSYTHLTLPTNREV